MIFLIIYIVSLEIFCFIWLPKFKDKKTYQSGISRLIHVLLYIHNTSKGLNSLLGNKERDE